MLIKHFEIKNSKILNRDLYFAIILLKGFNFIKENNAKS